MILKDVILVILISQQQVSCNNCVAAFGRGSGDIASIAVCRHNRFGQDNCRHDEDVGVICCECKISLN